MNTFFTSLSQASGKTLQPKGQIMPSRTTSILVIIGFLGTVVVWALLPGTMRHLQSSGWAQVPSDFSSPKAQSILAAQAGREETGWRRAAGRRATDPETRTEPPAPE
jgi:hypothetical protein